MADPTSHISMSKSLQPPSLSFFLSSTEWARKLYGPFQATDHEFRPPIQGPTSLVLSE